MSKKGKVKNIFGWIFGIIFGLIGFSALVSGDIIPAIVLFLIMSILIPTLSNFIKEKMNIKLSIWLKIVIIIVGLIIVGITIDTDFSTTTNSQEIQNNKLISNPNKDNSKISFSSEKVKLPSTPKYTNKECRRLCFETGDEGLKEGTYKDIFESRCKEFCDQIESLGGNNKLKSTIDDLYSSALIINAKNMNDIRYCTKYEFIQNICIINMMEFEVDGSACNLLNNNEDKIKCVDKFLDFHKDYYDSKICEMILEKEDCLLKVKSREAIFKKNPKICLTINNTESCYYSYFNEILKNDYDKLMSNRINFIVKNLEIENSDVAISLLKKLPININGVTADNIPVITANWSLCDDICDRNPDFMKYKDENSFSGKECYRTVCLTEITLFNENIGYEECVTFSSKDGKKEAFVDCLMAQAKRDNDSNLCNQLSENHEAFVSICKDNVKRYNEK